jgi:hypothetical protein
MSSGSVREKLHFLLPNTTLRLGQKPIWCIYTSVGALITDGFRIDDRAFGPCSEIHLQLLRTIAMTPFSYLSIDIIGADITITTILLFGVHRALLRAGKSAAAVHRVTLTLGSVLFGWLAVAMFLGWLGIFRSASSQPVPYIALAIGIPIVTGALFIRNSKQVREILDAVPQSWLIAFQFYRVVGVTFLILHAAGLLPGIFALPAGYGDAIVGLTALLVGIAYAQNHSKRYQLVALWNWFGIADLVIAVVAGFLSAPSRFQIFSLDAPNYLIGSFPLVMVPIYAVPLSIVLHVASLTKLREEQRSTAREVRAALI